MDMLADTWKLDLSVGVWTQLTTTFFQNASAPAIVCNGTLLPSVPYARVFAGSTSMPGYRKFVMVGGAAAAQPVHNPQAISRSELDCFDSSLWVLDVDTASWTFMEVSVQGE